MRKVLSPLAVLVLGIPIVAASQEPLLEGAAINETTLIEALAPPAASSGPRARGFKPGKGAQVAHPSGSAGLLITFETDSAVLPPEARASLDVVARALKDDRLAGLEFSIEGHADPRGSSAHNQDLSTARAEAVVAYLVNEHGISRDRLTAVGKGASELLNTKNPEARENRRVTIVTHPTPQEQN